jgi:hypothetical protein
MTALVADQFAATVGEDRRRASKQVEERRGDGEVSEKSKKK